MAKLGVAIVGVGGAVASTVIAGVRLMVRGLAPRVGMLTEKGPAGSGEDLNAFLKFTPLEEMVFAGWDVKPDSTYDAVIRHGVFRPDQLVAVKSELEAIKPWAAVFSQEYAQNLEGGHRVTAGSFREQVALIEADLVRFKKEHGLDRVVVVNLASTERWIERQPVHESLKSFEEGLDRNDPALSPAMRYVYAANRTGSPHLNFAPSLANIPALLEQAKECGVPYAGMDGKTGQTLVKTALAAMFRVRRLHVEGWYSTNFLGNNDGLVLHNPESNKTKVKSKASVLDSILGYQVENHQVHIHYYKPRGDAKEAWDNIDIHGFAGVPMQMKVNFLCQDSILAAPLVLDVVRLLDVAQRKGERGIQTQLSLFFKSPYVEPGAEPEHDLFNQERMLFDWAREHADRS